MAFRDEINSFFVDYVDAFVRNNAEALSDLWDATGVFPSPTGNFAKNWQAFRDHCVTLMDFYRQEGVIRHVGELLFANELSPNVAQACMAYQMYRAGDELVAEWEHVYILRRTDRWRVSLTIADGEIAAWSAKGTQPKLASPLRAE